MYNAKHIVFTLFKSTCTEKCEFVALHLYLGDPDPYLYGYGYISTMNTVVEFVKPLFCLMNQSK